MINKDRKSYKGLFIALEGSDGCGKTTAFEGLKKHYGDKISDPCHMGIIYSREPGGTKIGEDIRKILLDRKNDEMGPETEALLYAASRSQHVYEKILPALNEGKIVISDRYLLSSLAYQGVGRGLGLDEVYKINHWATGGLLPDMTLYLDVDPLTVLRRKAKNVEQDRLEEAGDDFFKKVYNGYKQAREYMPRLVLIDASKSRQEVMDACIEAIDSLIYENR